MPDFQKRIKDFDYSETNHYLSKHRDSYLYTTICLVISALIEIKRVKRFMVEETMVGDNIVYNVTMESGLEGYIGRSRSTGQISFIITDKSRIKWALEEGFTREQAYDLVGVCRECASIRHFISFLAGQKNYKFKGDYIKSN